MTLSYDRVVLILEVFFIVSCAACVLFLVLGLKRKTDEHLREFFGGMFAISTAFVLTFGFALFMLETS